MTDEPHINDEIETDEGKGVVTFVCCSSRVQVVLENSGRWVWADRRGDAWEVRQ